MTTRNRKKLREAVAAREQATAALRASRARFVEVGRVLSASNEEKLRKAMGLIDELLASLDKETSAEEAKRQVELAEGFSSAADDATDGAYVIAMLLNLMGEESDEPDDLAVLQVAYQALVQWLSMETSEIGTPDDSTDAGDMGADMYGYAMADRTLAAMRALRLRNAEVSGAVHHREDGSVDTQACLNEIAAMNAGLSSIAEGDRGAAYEHLAAHLTDAGLAAPELVESWRAAQARLKASGGLRSRPAALREAQRLTGDLVALKERAVKEDGSVSIKLIQPGWGSTGYYPRDVLERDGPGVFKAGTKMFWDHSTLTEDWERPERSLRDLAGELTEDAHWDPSGPEGAGLYSSAKVFSPYRDVLNEIAPSIGVSIVAYGKAESGTAEGKSGQLIKELIAADSVDYVTTPGAGGQVLSLFEAARQRLNPTPKEVVVVEVEKDPKFVEERQRREAAEGELITREAKDLISTKLVESKLPEASQKRLSESLKQSAPAKDGKLDVSAMTQRIDEAVKTEVEYLADLTKAGQITGMGDTTASEADASAELEVAFEGLGHSKESAKVAARGRS